MEKINGLLHKITILMATASREVFFVFNGNHLLWSNTFGMSQHMSIHKICIHGKNKWAITQDHDSYGNSKQGRLRRVCYYAQTRQSLGRLHTQSMDVDEDSDQNLDLALPNMSVWAIIRGICVYGLSTKIVCADPNIIRPNKKNTCVLGNPTLPKFTCET